VTSARPAAAARPWAIALAGGAILGAALGVRHVQGLFLQPVTLDYGWSREVFGFTLAIQNLVWGLAQPVTGMIADRYGSVRVLLPGLALYALGLWVTAEAATAGGFLFGNGVLVGVALSGTAFGVVYGALSRIVPADRRSWALGVAGAVGGLGQFCMVPFAQGLIDAAGWAPALVVLAATMIALAPLVVLLRDRPAAGGAAGAAADGEDRGMAAAIGEACRHRGFWLLNLGFLACGFQLAFIAGHLPAYLIDGGLGPEVAGGALAAISLANVAGTYLAGHLGGAMRRKHLLAGLYFVRAGAILVFAALPLSPAGVYAFAFVMGFLWLGTVPLTNGLVSQIFGVRYIATLFGFVFLGHQLGSFLGVWLGGAVFDATGSYDPVWIGAAVIGLVAALLHLPIDDARVVRAPSAGVPA